MRASEGAYRYPLLSALSARANEVMSRQLQYVPMPCRPAIQECTSEEQSRQLKSATARCEWISVVRGAAELTISSEFDDFQTQQCPRIASRSGGPCGRGMRMKLLRRRHMPLTRERHHEATTAFTCLLSRHALPNPHPACPAVPTLLPSPD